jgi:hypothetical protein
MMVFGLAGRAPLKMLRRKFVVGGWRWVARWSSMRADSLAGVFYVVWVGVKETGAVVRCGEVDGVLVSR